MRNETGLHEEIQNEFGELKRIQVGTEAHKVAVDGITKLMDRAIEIEKLENAAKNQEEEIELKRKQQEAENRDRIVKNCLTGASIVTGAGLTIWGALKSWEFEKEGTVTSVMGRMFMNCFRPKH